MLTYFYAKRPLIVLAFLAVNGPATLTTIGLLEKSSQALKRIQVQHGT